MVDGDLAVPTLLFTDEAVRSAACPDGKKVEYFRDEMLRGLVLQVTKNDVRTFTAETRLENGGKSHSRLGGIDELTVREARIACLRALDDKKREISRAEKALGATSIAEIFEQYCRANNIIAENARNYRHVLRVYGCELWECPVETVTRKAVLAKREAIKNGSFASWHIERRKNDPSHPATRAKGSAGMANDFIAYGSMICTWHGISREKNPFTGIEPYPEERTRTSIAIEPKWWPAIYRSVCRMSSDWRVIFWTTVLTGARPRAVVGMLRKRLDLDSGVYELSKDREECAGWKPANTPAWSYPLDTNLLAMLREHCDWQRVDDVYVFRSKIQKRAGKRISTTVVNNVFARIREDCGLPKEFTPYSARYTRGTYSELLFGDSLLVQRMLNHQSEWGRGQTVGGRRMSATPGYVRTLTEQVRPKVQDYADTIFELCGAKPMREPTRRIFIDNESLTIFDRYIMAFEEGRLNELLSGMGEDVEAK